MQSRLASEQTLKWQTDKLFAYEGSPPMTNDAKRTDPDYAPPRPGANMKLNSDQEVKWVKQLPLRLKDYAKWVKRFLHERK